MLNTNWNSQTIFDSSFKCSSCVTRIAVVNYTGRRLTNTYPLSRNVGVTLMDLPKRSLYYTWAFYNARWVLVRSKTQFHNIRPLKWARFRRCWHIGRFRLRGIRHGRPQPMKRRHKAEWFLSRRTMPFPVVGLLRWLNKLIPTGLMFGHIMAAPGDNRLVKRFHLINCLWMIGGHRENI